MRVSVLWLATGDWCSLPRYHLKRSTYVILIFNGELVICLCKRRHFAAYRACCTPVFLVFGCAMRRVPQCLVRDVGMCCTLVWITKDALWFGFLIDIVLLCGYRW